MGSEGMDIAFTQVVNSRLADVGVNSGVSAMQQISVTGAFAFGGINGFPTGRGDYTAVASDTLNWIHGKHSVKFGGEYRRINNNNFAYSPGRFTCANIAAFIDDKATAFTANPSNQASRIYANGLGFFLTDSERLKPTFMLSIGLRYDWNSTPTEGGNRFVVFDPLTISLRKPNQLYNQSARNFEPRLGFSWDVFGRGKTVIRSAYALQTDQPKTSLVSGLASNPPFAFPVSFSPTAAIQSVSFSNAFALSCGSVAPASIAQNYKNAYFHSYNFTIQMHSSSTLTVSSTHSPTTPPH